ncbi:hypothetical protein FEM48_Zijuj11G0085100 [Ziziphus jujuba var. spinosa]|uniref:Late embryogenesis abundant protein 6 n=1 Tax=Ziziphus jujuba var. spinosa TaxID=714518 RepID=A0A978UHW3_ZIZJJ|nr:hypothetical protein FEM48_Zijuj11G0085100 [Ziziphus jujuba var. spinosa]
MQSAKEKLSNMASAAKEHLNINKAKVEEKVEKAGARTEEEKKIVEERKKAKEAEAKMELHEAKAKHAAEKLGAKQSHLYDQVHHHHGHHPLGTSKPKVGSSVPTTPLGKHPPGTYQM